MAVAEITTPTTPQRQEKIVDQSYWSLVWWKFRKNKLAIIGAIIVIGFYFVCGVAAEFFAPYSLQFESDFPEAPPQWPRFIDQEGEFHLRPFVYGMEEKVEYGAAQTLL